MFRKRDRRQPLVIAAARARAVLTAFDDALSQAVPLLTLPESGAGEHRPATRARAAAALRAVEESLAELETCFAEAIAGARDWHRRGELAAAEGRGDLSAQARHQASEAEAIAAAYAVEIAAARALIQGWAGHVDDAPPTPGDRVGAT